MIYRVDKYLTLFVRYGNKVEAACYNCTQDEDSYNTSTNKLLQTAGCPAKTPVVSLGCTDASLYSDCGVCTSCGYVKTSAAGVISCYSDSGCSSGCTPIPEVSYISHYNKLGAALYQSLPSITLTLIGSFLIYLLFFKKKPN